VTDHGFGWSCAAGVFHVFSDELAVGVGAMVMRDFDEETIVIPGIQGTWRFAEDWEVRVLGP